MGDKEKTLEILLEKVPEIKECFNVESEYFGEMIKIILNSNPEGYYEKHHIVPRCFFKKKKIKINHSENNLVKLSYFDHLKVHYLACLCAKPIVKKSLTSAIFLMTQVQIKDFEDLNRFFETANFKELEKIKEEYGQIISERQRKYTTEAQRKRAQKLSSEKFKKSEKFREWRERRKKSESYRQSLKRYTASSKAKEAHKKYIKSEKGKQATHRYNTSVKGKKAEKKYRHSEKGEIARKNYETSFKGKITRKKYNTSEKGKKSRKEYGTQKCFFANQVYTLEGLAARFRREGIEHSYVKAKEFLIPMTVKRQSEKLYILSL